MCPILPGFKVTPVPGWGNVCGMEAQLWTL